MAYEFLNFQETLAPWENYVQLIVGCG